MKRLLLSLFILLGAFPVWGQYTGGISSDPFSSIDIVDDFQAGNTATTTAATFGFSTTALSTGTGGGATGIPVLYGAMRFNSHATNDNSGFILAIGSQNVFSSVSSATVWTSTDWSYDVIFKPGSNSTAITNIGMFIGLAAAFNSDPMAGAGSIGIRFDSDRTDATFVFVTCDSTTNGCASAGDDTNQKVVASTITPVAGTNYRFRIRRAAVGVGGNPTIYMRVNDEAEKTFCASGCSDLATEVPDGTIGLAPIVLYVTRTTTGVLSGDLDYLRLRIPNIPARY